MSTQSAPGINAPCAYDQPKGVPPNFSTLAAQAAAILPGNMQIVNTLVGPPRALLETYAAGGRQGTFLNPGNGGIDTFNISMPGGPGGGESSNIGNNIGISSQVAGSMPGSAIAVSTPNPNFQG